MGRTQGQRLGQHRHTVHGDADGVVFLTAIAQIRNLRGVAPALEQAQGFHGGQEGVVAHAIALGLQQRRGVAPAANRNCQGIHNQSLRLRSLELPPVNGNDVVAQRLTQPDALAEA